METSLSGQFGRYRIVRALASGGMGSVYEAHDTDLDRRIALKVPHGDPALIERLRREARAAARIDPHPNICQIYDVGQVGDTHYLTMQLIDGSDLSHWTDATNLLPLPRAVELVATIARAMQYMHERNCVHRDLKPSNIKVKPGDVPVVMDFGLARSSDDTRLTEAGKQPGTWSYMPPEQMKGEPATPSFDIYSLGVILYEMATGQRPFSGPPHSLFYQVAMQPEPPPAPSTVRRGLDAAFDALCLKALAKNKSERYASMAEFAAALDAYVRRPPGRTTGLRPPGPTTHQMPAPVLDVVPVEPAVAAPTVPPVGLPESTRPVAPRPRPETRERKVRPPGPTTAPPPLPADELRRQLLTNPKDVELRRRYLAVRTPELRDADLRRVRWRLQLVRVLFWAALITGVATAAALVGGPTMVGAAGVLVGGLVGLLVATQHLGGEGSVSYVAGGGAVVGMALIWPTGVALGLAVLGTVGIVMGAIGGAIGGAVVGLVVGVLVGIVNRVVSGGRAGKAAVTWCGALLGAAIAVRWDDLANLLRLLPGAKTAVPPKWEWLPDLLQWPRLLEALPKDEAALYGAVAGAVLGMLVGLRSANRAVEEWTRLGPVPFSACLGGLRDAAWRYGLGGVKEGGR